MRPGTLVGGTAANQVFAVNVCGIADEVRITALLPGISEEDVQIDIDRGVLTITAKRHGWEHREGEQWYLREFNEGQFTRSLSLPFPVEVERVTAYLTNGVLYLTLPKAEAAKPRRIQIGAGQQHQLSETRE